MAAILGVHAPHAKLGNRSGTICAEEARSLAGQPPPGVVVHEHGGKSLEGCDGVKMSRMQHGDPIFQRLPVRHLPRRLVVRLGVPDRDVQDRIRWYHATAHGIERRAFFQEHRDREHFMGHSGARAFLEWAKDCGVRVSHEQPARGR